MAGMNKHVVIGAAALSLLAGTVGAQQDDFSRPLSRTKERATQPGVTSSRIQISSQEGDQHYEVSIVDGDVSAKVNGKKVPAERIRRSKDKVEILDKNGKVLKSFEISLAAPLAPRGWTAVGGEPNAGAIEMAGRPRVMIGITMGEEEDGIAVEHVYEGLPAAKAGLKSGDVIIEVDGKGDLTQKVFREVLNAKEPGDKVKLKIRRDGQEKELTVELQKFDAEKLGGGPLDMADPAMPKDAWREVFRGNEEWQKRIEEMMRGMPGQHRAFVWGNGPEGDLRFMPLTPLGGDAKRLDELNAQMDKKLAELDKKIAKLSEQMARIEKMMDKLAERQRD